MKGQITEAEAPILWLSDVKNWLTGKDPDAGEYWGQEEKGETEGKMVGWHHLLNEHEFEQTVGDSEGQGSLACCSPRVQSRTRLNNNSIAGIEAEFWCNGGISIGRDK